jgi:hypothetical protein
MAVGGAAMPAEAADGVSAAGFTCAAAIGTLKGQFLSEDWPKREATAVQEKRLCGLLYGAIPNLVRMDLLRDECVRVSGVGRVGGSRLLPLPHAFLVVSASFTSVLDGADIPHREKALPYKRLRTFNHDL